MTDQQQDRQTDRAFTRRQLQRLAIAAGMTLKDGSAVVVGGDKCPSVAKIKDAIGFDARRMTREQFSDAKDDFGVARPYFHAQHEGNELISALLKEWSGTTDCDGETDLETYLQICM